MSTTRSNVLAGLFLLVSVGLAVWGAFILSSSGPGGASTTYVVRFGVDVGAPGIKSGSPIMLGGQEIGTVLEVGFGGLDINSDGQADFFDYLEAARSVPPSDPPEPDIVDVLVRVRKDIPLHADAAVYLDRPLIGSLSAINIVSVGTPGAPNIKPADALKASIPSPLAPEAPVLIGRLAPPAALQQLGLGPEKIEKISEAIDDVADAADRVATIIERNERVINATFDDVNAVVADARSRWERPQSGWGARTDDVFERASRMAANVETESDGLFSDARGVVGRVDEIVARNEQGVDNTIASIESASAALERSLGTRAEEIVARADAVLQRLDSFSRQLNAFIVEESPSVRRSLANFRLMSDQLKLAALEVRAQPWRVLYQPTNKEIQTQILYDSARAYAESVGDLRAASEALEASLASMRTGGGSTPASAAANASVTSAMPEGAASGGAESSQAELSRMVAEMREAFERYRKAEIELLKRMASPSP
ncbi:MAG: hypothetical protein SFZ23_09900 [Planctomycetota bacterium]|nr:hypothetical protein [Planctomycetota bacterium]